MHIVAKFLNGDTASFDHIENYNHLIEQVRQARQVCSFDNVQLFDDNMNITKQIQQNGEYFILIQPYQLVLDKAFRAFVDFQVHFQTSMPILYVDAFRDVMEWYDREWEPPVRTRRFFDENEQQNEYVTKMYDFQERLLSLHPLSAVQYSMETVMESFIDMFYAYYEYMYL